MITSDGDTGALDRMDFAERSPPQWLYLGEHEVIVITPTSGYGETSAAYVAYAPAEKPDADRTEAINRLPSRNGFEVLRVKNDIHTPHLAAAKYRAAHASICQP